MKQPIERICLIAGIGTSPAVLTETVWALAHQKKPVVPDEVVVITTTVGKRKLKNEILNGKHSVWEQLKDALRKEKVKVDGKLRFNEDRVKVMRDSEDSPMDDLRTGKDSLSAADFMLHELRAYTNESDTTVLCSIAGGRKTMSALLFSCMTLVGREQDKVYHVLIPPEYECGMEPPFYFPRNGASHRLLSRGRPTGKKVLSIRIGIELFDVPFVRMRGWYNEKFKSSLPTYRTLISRFQTIAPPARVYPKIEIDVANGVLKVNSDVCDVGAAGFAQLLIYASGITQTGEIYDRLHKLKEQCGVAKFDWIARFQNTVKFEKSRDHFEENDVDKLLAVAKIADSLRKKLDASGFDGHSRDLVPMRGNPVVFPVKTIKWVNREKLMDICGYLFSADAT